jgi:hypothetical protein
MRTNYAMETFYIEVGMKRLFAASALALFALAPSIGSACEYDVSGSAAPSDQLGLAPAPAATKVPAPTVAKAPPSMTAKQVVAKVKAPVPTAKVAALSTN